MTRRLDPLAKAEPVILAVALAAAGLATAAHIATGRIKAAWDSAVTWAEWRS